MAFKYEYTRLEHEIQHSHLTYKNKKTCYKQSNKLRVSVIGDVIIGFDIGREPFLLGLLWDQIPQTVYKE